MWSVWEGKTRSSRSSAASDGTLVASAAARGGAGGGDAGDVRVAWSVRRFSRAREVAMRTGGSAAVSLREEA